MLTVNSAIRAAGGGNEHRRTHRSFARLPADYRGDDYSRPREFMKTKDPKMEQLYEFLRGCRLEQEFTLNRSFNRAMDGEPRITFIAHDLADALEDKDESQ